ncbi:ORF6N domain-containing protein [Aliarcobacter butzleri]|uniref:ORF6N domain-containing protein n=1 Tax=Aliarcobacter butzleri TaxID=28197 RepID=UPI0021B694A5|nr:ORF6N domain-containing protein [Aliarcobacter butzleri]MCT7574919.1 ORF6N domain-containing protein [Aliarcobacter butzleri]MDK2081350.1 ORF6N domain-containing protein [Aliarcobacter butzleri]
MSELAIVENQRIDDKIYTIRGVQVMLDEDLARLYQVESKRLNEQVKRNIERFPEKFRFQLTADEYEILRSQIATLSLDKAWGKHRKYLPYAFTEQGVSMLSAVLKSQIAVEVSIKIIDSFVNMRKFLSQNSSIFARLETIEEKQLKYKLESDEKFNQIFKAIEDKTITKKQHIFYDGQIFDAYIFVSDIIKSAKKSIKLIDNYIDESTFLLFTKRDETVEAIIYTKNISKELELDLKKHNSQYPKIELKKFDLSHDRFLIIDNIKVYHFGASLKDLGKKWFAVSKMDINSFDMIGRLK